MTDAQRRQAETAAARERAKAQVLAELGVTRAENALFVAVGYGCTEPPADMPRRAVMEDYNPCGPRVTEAETRAALAGALAKGWLQVIDEDALARITALLRAARVLGPIHGLPLVGGVDFTEAGAALWRRIGDEWRRLWDRWGGRPVGPPCAYTDLVREQTAWYFPSRAAADAGAAELRAEDEGVRVTGPTPTGPWRAQWWRRFPEGYRIDVEERQHWQGRGGGGGERCWLERPAHAADPRRLQDVLDRHNVRLAEWVLLASMEGGCLKLQGANPLARLVACASRELGAAVSEAECQAGLDACLRYGWLRVVDGQVVEEVRALLQDDAAVLAVPKAATYHPVGRSTDPWQFLRGKRVPVPPRPESRWGEIDFTPAGAALYRAVSAAWLGPAWEDGLRVSNGFAWEEHRYCEAVEPLELVVREHEVWNGTRVRARRLFAIGPWCVSWWEWFPLGYRMELELAASPGITRG